MASKYAIIHEAPAAGGISILEVARVDADDETAALVAWYQQRNGDRIPTIRARKRDGAPCIDYGFGETILRQYTAVSR